MATKKKKKKKKKKNKRKVLMTKATKHYPKKSRAGFKPPNPVSGARYTMISFRLSQKQLDYMERIVEQATEVYGKTVVSRTWLILKCLEYGVPLLREEILEKKKLPGWTPYYE